MVRHTPRPPFLTARAESPYLAVSESQRLECRHRSHGIQQYPGRIANVASRSARRSLQLALSAALALGLTSCIADAPLDSLDPQGPAARQIDDLSFPVFVIAGIILAIVLAGMLIAIIRYRDKGQAEPKQIHGNAVLEVVWTAIPIILLAGLAVPTVQTIFDLTECASDAMEVDVIGHQWWFEYQYPEEGITTANIMVIPAGKEVCLNMTSDDVLHNYWIPKLNGKRYLVPGQQTTLILEADQPGEYWGQCGEFCGLSHALMRARVRAVDQADYDAWVARMLKPAAPPEGSLATTGLDEFNGICSTCHVIDGVNELDDPIGPNLTHFADPYRNVFAGASLDRTDEHLAEWLADPPTIKPGSFMPDLNLTADEIDSLVAYLQGLDPTKEN
ncbi:MAG: cytochrome c oxidase subunit II [Acidimicrobiia bacterium]|nr:cytochrome c oxidase subunit II [Acidimicrobiia bacterium]